MRLPIFHTELVLRGGAHTIRLPDIPVNREALVNVYQPEGRPPRTPAGPSPYLLCFPVSMRAAVESSPDVVLRFWSSDHASRSVVHVTAHTPAEPGDVLYPWPGTAYRRVRQAQFILPGLTPFWSWDLGYEPPEELERRRREAEAYQVEALWAAAYPDWPDRARILASTSGVP